MNIKIIAKIQTNYQINLQKHIKYDIIKKYKEYTKSILKQERPISSKR